MKITKISAYSVQLPLSEGAYSWSTQSFPSFDSTVVALETDEGLVGYGESCPLGPTYLPAYAEGVRAGIAKLAPDLLGEDPTALDVINDRMDALLKGHPYVKSAIDLACWDLLGKKTARPVYALLGGKRQNAVKLFKVVSRAAPDAMLERMRAYREAGFQNFQVKVGEDPDRDIARLELLAPDVQEGEIIDADANTGWRQHDAIRIAQAAGAIAHETRANIYLEQPCPSYEECLAVRRHCDLPFILDECMIDLRALLRGVADGAMDLINLKINRFGGLTRARQIRDLCISLGVTMTIEDSWGGEIATSAIAHLAQSTPAAFHFQSSAFHQYHTLAIAAGGPTVKGGVMCASDSPGLGVEPDFDALGAPVLQAEIKRA